MITDEQGRKWMFKKLYDAGWRYYLKAYNGCVYLTTKKPMFCEKGKLMNPYNGGITKCTSDFEIFITEMKKNELLDIAEELGIIDWSKVPVDTPVRVWNNESTTKERRHFAGYKNGYVLTWSHGGTSWSSPKHCVSEWDHAELVKL